MFLPGPLKEAWSVCLSVLLKGEWPLSISSLAFLNPCLRVCVCVYIQEHTRVGADTSQDIQLFGIGIQPEHCIIDIAPDGDITLCPVENAR